MSIPEERAELYIARRRDYSDGQKSEIRAWSETIATLSDDDFVVKAAEMIWLSAFAENNPRSAYHPMCDMCHDEALRRGNANLYVMAFDKAKRDAGVSK